MKKIYTLLLAIFLLQGAWAQYTHRPNCNKQSNCNCERNDRNNRQDNNRERRGSIGGGLKVFVPQANFNSRTFDPSVGYTVNFYTPMRLRVFETGFIYSNSRLGKVDRDVRNFGSNSTHNYGDGDFSVATQNHVFMVPFRFRPFNRDFQPYAEVMAGVVSHTTKSKFAPQDDYNASISTVENRGITGAVGYGVGARIVIGRFTMLDLKFESMKGGQINSVDPNSVTITPNGDLSFGTLPISSNQYTCSAGLSFQF